MTQHSTSRRALLTAALAAPAVAVGAPLLTAAPAAAVDPVGGCQILVDWKPITLYEGVVENDPVAPAEARVIRLAGTEFLQLRGLVTGTLTADAALGTLHPDIRPVKVTRGVCPRNNSLGVNSVRIEVNTSGVLWAFGPQAATKVTWIQLDNFSSVMR
ncbi:hypothetical protein [Streptomyces sp. SS]|uniref:hypothetical protein n=1 Tax=Streptomyces sp. SS TaxID=260742 RepID=UPI0002F9CA7E|nr:hypothetical protein [Streptomyces sp. SS]